MDGPPPPKGVVGTKVKVKVTSLHYKKKCGQVFGPQYETTFAPGVVTAYTKETGKGRGGRRVGYVTAKYLWADGKEVEKKILAKSVELAPDDDPVHQQQWVVDARARAANPPAASAAAAEAPAAEAPEDDPAYEVAPLPPLPEPTIHVAPAVPPPAAPAPAPAPSPPSAGTGTGAGAGTATATATARSPPSAQRGPPPGVAPVAECHGRKWYPCAQDLKAGVPPATIQWHMRDIFGDEVYPGSFAAKRLQSSRSPYLDTWMLMFPDTQLAETLRLTNIELKDIGKKEMTKGGLVKFFGITILITRFEFYQRRDLWSTNSPSKYIEPAAFGKKTGMTRDRYDEIFSNLRFSDQPKEKPADMTEAEYRWLLVDGFIERFNDHRAARLHPSDTITVDESISRWYGLGGNWIDIGLPMYVAMERKPENGGEIQDSCDGDTGIMLRLIVVKGADPDPNANELPHGANVMLDLVEPWLNKARRAVKGDSFFASVAAASALDDANMDFTGPVKQATKQFPMDYLKNFVLPDGRGSHHAVCCYDDNGDIDMIAVVWVDRERRYFVCKNGSLRPGTVIERSRWRQFEPDAEQLEHVPPSLRVGNAARIDVTTAQPELVEKYYSYCALIDQHNRSRQANLKLETKLHTKDWATRLNLSVTGICTVDAWKLWSALQKDNVDESTHISEHDFYLNLADEMIDNCIDLSHLPSPVPAASVATLEATVPTLVPTTRKKRPVLGTDGNGKKIYGPPGKATYQGRCNGKGCTKRGTFVCSACRAVTGEEVHFCNPSGAKRKLCECTAWVDHVNSKHPKLT